MTQTSHHIAAIAILADLRKEGMAGVSILPSSTGITGGRVLEIGLSILVTIIILLGLIIG